MAFITWRLNSNKRSKWKNGSKLTLTTHVDHPYIVSTAKMILCYEDGNSSYQLVAIALNAVFFPYIKSRGEV